jgi:2-amino-4-hydroxy-6-hydroxymethyldihydropteridine diphosphokinase
MPLKRVFLSLGSNLGDRQANLDNALKALEAAGIRIVQKSSLYETEPQELKTQPWFLNIAVECETKLFPLQLLSATQRIERDLGRERGARAIPKGPRLIDIDILLFGQAIIETPRLTVPHPRMLERRFVLEPLIEISPALRNPVKGGLYKDGLSKVRGQIVRRYSPISS